MRGEHVLQQRGARAALADDDDRLVDLLVGDLGVPLVGLLNLEPALQQDQDVRAGPDPAHQVEFGLLLQRLDVDTEWLAPVVRAEVVQPGVAYGGLEQGPLIQRHDAADVHAVALFVDALHPVRAFRGPPLHSVISF